METVPPRGLTASLGPSLGAGLVVLLAGALGSLPWLVLMIRDSSSLAQPQILAFVPLFLLSGFVVAWTHIQWIRPLAEVLEVTLGGENTPKSRGAALVRSLYSGVSGMRLRLKADAQQKDDRWRSAFDALVRRDKGVGLEPEAKVVVDAVEAAIEKQNGLIRQDIRRVVDAQQAGRAIARDLSAQVRLAERNWATASHGARRAEAGLVGVGPEMDARYRAEQERIESFQAAALDFEAALQRSIASAEKLAAQAHRATDAASREAEREARIARGGRPAPVEAPPLDAWAADLDSTARELRRACNLLQTPLSLEPAERTTLERDALEAMIECGRTACSAIDATGPLLRFISRWADAYEADLSRLWHRVKRAAGQEEGASNEEPTLEATLADLDSSAEAARTRIEAAAARAVRILQTVRV